MCLYVFGPSKVFIVDGFCTTVRRFTSTNQRPSFWVPVHFISPLQKPICCSCIVRMSRDGTNYSSDETKESCQLCSLDGALYIEISTPRIVRLMHWLHQPETANKEPSVGTWSRKPSTSMLHASRITIFRLTSGFSSNWFREEDTM